MTEAHLQSAQFGASRPVQQLHWGRGTPTFPPDSEIDRLMEGYRSLFNLQRDEARDDSIEIDPREIGERTLERLRYHGFNRISLGVQDLDPKVQKAVNRIQPQAMTEAVLDEARALGFRSINRSDLWSTLSDTGILCRDSRACHRDGT